MRIKFIYIFYAKRVLHSTGGDDDDDGDGLDLVWTRAIKLFSLGIY